ncbi:DNA-binding protein [Arthrobacter sp. PAMC25564]|uniref:helix-turn-helix domain-containing protein n=1 Tax=Arthrobacter sp. PAMC25564 TaxID=2565366 RepID=UPI0010A26B30|nr:helix-turn-helix domain-containing protein [Arthrobacter sp. PAMC25564]QCB97097.1 DNA-binding protein [Arthrobacter sp. PAMC25564]
MDDTPLMTAADLAKRLNLTTATVYEKCKTGQWPHIKLGRSYRFTEEHYRAIIEPPVPFKRPSRAARERFKGMI